MLNVVMLSVVMLSVVMLSFIMLSVVMLNVVMLNVIMLNIVAPLSLVITLLRNLRSRKYSLNRLNKKLDLGLTK
jgi:hypothetical protein